MWYLEAFDKDTSLLVKDYALRGLLTEALKEVVDLPAVWEIDGIEYPPEAGAYDVDAEQVRQLSSYIEGAPVLELNYDYQVEFYTDEQTAGL